MIEVGELLNDPDFYQILQRKNENFKAIVQFLSGDEMMRLPEGHRYKEALRIDTKFDLNLQDEIIYKGTEYKIIAFEDWSVYGYKNFTAIRLNELEKSNSSGFRIE